MGKIGLLAVAAAGIYQPNQILNGHFREDAVSRKKEYPLLDSNSRMWCPKRLQRWRYMFKRKVNQKLFGYPARALSVDWRVEALAQIPSIGLTRRPAPRRSRGHVVCLLLCTPA